MRRPQTLAWIACSVAGVALLAWLLNSSQSAVTRSGVREVRVAAAADLKFALDACAREFEQQQPGIHLRVSYGASGSFYAQLTNHAPFDVFLSADTDYPHKLVAAGLASEQLEFTYAVGHLVLWAPATSQIEVEQLGAKALLDPSVRKLAIANPRYAPYGRAALAALKSLEVHDQVQDKLVLGENVAQTLQFVQSGSADLAILGQSLILAPELRGQGRYWKIPGDAHPRLEQGGVILSWAQDLAAAKEFRSFLLGPAGMAVFKRYGFDSPEDP